MAAKRVTKKQTEADLEARIRAAVRVAFGLPDSVIKEQIKFTFKFGRQTLEADARKSRAEARLDVLLELDKRPLAVMELKRPGLALTLDDAEQGLSYARLVQPPAPLVVVTNGTDVKFYETYSGKEWDAKDKSEAALKALFESASRVAAADLKRAVDTLMGTAPSVWMQAVRLVSAETIKELTASWDEPARPFIEDFLSPRGATQQLVRHLLAGERLLVLEGTPLSGKSNVLRELCLQTNASDTMATLYIDAGTGGRAEIHPGRDRVDKAVTFAVAGSGKTRSIVNGIDPSRRSLVLTYTTNTERDLTNRIARKLGHLPDNVTVWTYFSFLNRFCYKPLLQTEMQSRGISFEAPSRASSRVRSGNRARYMHGDRVYHCRMAKLVADKGYMPELLARLERYYDDVFVDEVQDFGGHDFNFLLDLSKARARFQFVGDFYQHTFSTSHDGNVNSSLHEDYGKYRQRFAKAGFHVDTTSLSKSHRCGHVVCGHIAQTLGIPIESEGTTKSAVFVVDSQAEVDRLHGDPKVVKLFLEEHWLYGCESHNWGACKGLDHYQDICVALNAKSWTQFMNGELPQAKPMTRNKLYVACSRARGNLFIAPERLFKKHRHL